MALLDFLRPKKKPENPPAQLQQTSGEFQIINASRIEDIGNLMAHGHSTSVTNPNQALKFGEYYNCINKISNTTSTLTCNFYNKDIKLSENDYAQVFFWKKMLSPGVSSAKTIKAWVTNHLKGGNGYLIVHRNKNMEPIRYTHKEWTEMIPFRNDGEPWYLDTKTKEVYHWYNVLHLADIINDDLIGITKVRHYAETLGKSKAANEFVNKYFNAGLFLSGVIKYPTGSGVDEESIPQLKREIENAYGGVSKSGRVMILTEGGDLQQLKTDIPLSDTQWIESEKTTKDDIRSAFGVPENLHDEGKRTEYYENAVLPIIRQIEAEVNTKIIETYNQPDIKFKFEVESILRADVRTKAEVIEKNLRNSIYTINEARALYNLPPIEGGDVPMVMANNMVPLEQLEEFINSKMR